MSQERWFQVLGILIFVAGFGVSFYYRYKAEKAGEKVSWEDEGAFIMIFLRLFGGLMWLGVLLYLIYPPALAWSKVALPLWLRWTGVVVAAAAVPGYWWLFHSIGKNITQTVKTRKDHELVTFGPYRWVRHPLYTFGFLTFTSYALIAASWFIAAVALLAFSLLMARLPKEEERLIERFGQQYIDYKARTGCLVPKL